MSDVSRRLHERLRRPPCDASVPGSLPVLFFGDLYRARIATIGINPSWQECLSRDKQELSGAKRRFETLSSLNVRSRPAITEIQATTALSTMRAYFLVDGNRYSWFAGYGRVVEGMGASYEHGSAAHLDLIQEATFPAWSKLRAANREEAERLLKDDLPFLLWQIDAFPFKVLICASSLVWQTISDQLEATKMAEGDTGKRKWQVAVATRNCRKLALAGWNRPLAQAPGLFRAEQQQLGETIADALRRLDLTW